MVNVSQEATIAFLENACRNWRHVPRLSKDDIGDVRSALERFQRQIEAAAVERVTALDLARAMEPNLFSDDGHIRHRAASPYDVGGRQQMAVNTAQAILNNLPALANKGGAGNGEG